MGQSEDSTHFHQLQFGIGLFSFDINMSKDVNDYTRYDYSLLNSVYGIFKVNKIAARITLSGAKQYTNTYDVRTIELTSHRKTIKKNFNIGLSLFREFGTERIKPFIGVYLSSQIFDTRLYFDPNRNGLEGPQAQLLRVSGFEIRTGVLAGLSIQISNRLYFFIETSAVLRYVNSRFDAFSRNTWSYGKIEKSLNSHFTPVQQSGLSFKIGK